MEPGRLLLVVDMNDASCLTLDITALSHDGRGIARLAAQANAPRQGGAVIFVAGALPGQQVRARITRRKSSFWEAETTELLRPATDAAPPICPHGETCGGCPLQTMPYARQLQWKRTLVLDALSRIGGLRRADLDALLDQPAPSPALTRFRNKMEFAFGADAASGEIVLGLRRRSGRAVTAVPGCVLMPPEAQDMVPLARTLAHRSGFAAYTPPPPRGDNPTEAPGKNSPRRRPTRRDCRRADADDGFWRFFTLRRGLAADMCTPRWWAQCITSPGDGAQRAAVHAMGVELLSAFPRLTAFIHEERAAADALAFGETRVRVIDATGSDDPAAARLFLPLAGRGFAMDAASFFQVNTGAAQGLARQAAQMMAEAREGMPPSGALLDLYCGVGAPGLLLADNYETLLGLEQDPRAVRLARGNAAAQGMRHCRYDAGDAAVLLERLAAGRDPLLQKFAPTDSGGSPSAIDALVDPPRSGLSPRALAALVALAPERILYISCNPTTLARDAARLGRSYTLERLAAVDMFPHTPHVECLSLWRRAG